MTDTAENKSRTQRTPSLWTPARVPTFRNLLIAGFVSDIGAFMQSVGAAWLMVSLNAGPMYVALTQTASSLPFFLLALPAGSLGDIVDRRKLILATETWMTGVALLMGVLAIGGFVTPWILLALTFALAAGEAFETPTWRAILPELVSKDDLAAASALNGIEFNLARAVGPGLAGAIISAAGVSTAFVVNFFSFFGVILVIARWKRPKHKTSLPPETIEGATVAAVRYVRHSPGILKVLVSTGVVMFFSSPLFALLPAVARGASASATGYGILLGCFGTGAILGALVLEPLRSRYSTATIVSAGTAVLGLVIVAISGFHRLSALSPLAFIGGAAWVLFISLISALVQNLAPDWVRARVLAIFTLVYMGSFALGSAAWGAAAQKAGIGRALLYAGIGTIASAAFVLFVKLPTSIPDLSPWHHWRMPIIAKAGETDLEVGPMLVTVEYMVIPEQQAKFVEAINRYSRIRRRDGAYEWGIFQDTEDPRRYVETFLVHSLAEHMRQHERQTQADSELERQVSSCISGEAKVHHMIYAHSKATSTFPATPDKRANRTSGI